MLCHIITEPICTRTGSLDASSCTNYSPPTHSSLLPDALTSLTAYFCTFLSSGFSFSSLSYATYLFISEERGLTGSCPQGFLYSTKHLLYGASSEEVRRNPWSCLLVLSGFFLSPSFFFFFGVCTLLVLQAVQALPSRALCEITPVCCFSFFHLCVSVCVHLPVSLLPVMIQLDPPPQHTRTYAENGLTSMNLKTCSTKMHVLPWDALGSECLKTLRAA